MKTVVTRLKTLSLLLALSVFPCAAGAQTLSVRPGREFTLRAGQRATSKAEGLKVRFASVANDSRCPAGVACVWAGNAEVLIEVESGGRRATLRLNTLGGSDYSKEARHGRYTVALVALNPRPRASGRLKATDYTATLVVRKE